MTLPIASPWFRATRQAPGVTRIDEPHVHILFRANMYLVEGDDRDMILDTGMGLGDLATFVAAHRANRDKPLICVSSHAHFDHIGSAHAFDERLMHPAESLDQADPPPVSLYGEDYSAGLHDLAARAGYPPIRGLLIDALPAPGYDPRSYTLQPAPPTGSLCAGDRIDLGGLELQVLHLPGHSPGGIGLFDPASGRLFSGDAIYDGPLVYQGEGTSIPDYLQAFETLEALPVTSVHGGHGELFGKERMSQIIAEYRGLWLP